MCDYYHGGIAIKPSLVLIEKWIASNEIGEVDNENMPHVVDEEISEKTNGESVSNNDERGARDVSEQISLPKTLEMNYDEDNQKVPKVHQLSDEPSTSLLGVKKKSRHSTSKHKSKKKDRHNQNFGLQSRVTIHPQFDLFSKLVDHTVALQNDREPEQKVSENSDKIDGNKKFEATATYPHSSEMGHQLYDETVTEVEPQSDLTDIHETEHERPISVTANNGNNARRLSYSYVRTMSEDFSYAVNNVQHHEFHRTNAEYFHGHELQNQTPRPYIQIFDDDDDNNKPIDCSMTTHQHYMPSDLAHNNSTVHPTDSASFVSPAAALRTGFAGSGFLPYPARSFIDDQQWAHRSDLHHPAAQPAFARPSILQNSLDSVSHLAAPTTNGIAAQASATTMETVDASSQTENDEKTVDHSCAGNFYKTAMESNNNFFLSAFNYLCTTLMANCGALNGTSLSFARSSSQSMNQNGSQNLPDLRLENVSNHERTQAANDSNGRRMKIARKTKKGIPQKRSQRILDMEAQREKEDESNRNANAEEAIPSKKAKSDCNQEFEIENEVNAAATDHLVSVPRKITFATKGYRISVETMETPPMETPKRPSNYRRRKMI